MKYYFNYFHKHCFSECMVLKIQAWKHQYLWILFLNQFIVADIITCYILIQKKKKTKKTSFPFCSLKILQMIKEKTYKMSGNQFFISIFSFMHFFILFGIFFIVNCICLCVLKFSRVQEFVCVFKNNYEKMFKKVY